MAKKSANLYTRIEPSLKAQAEGILSTLGVSTSHAINMFYKQIVLHRGLPFAVQIPHTAPRAFEGMSESEIDKELEKGYTDMVEGKTKPAKQVFSNIRQQYDI